MRQTRMSQVAGTRTKNEALRRYAAPRQAGKGWEGKAGGTIGACRPAIVFVGSREGRWMGAPGEPIQFSCHRPSRICSHYNAHGRFCQYFEQIRCMMPVPVVAALVSAGLSCPDSLVGPGLANAL